MRPKRGVDVAHPARIPDEAVPAQPLLLSAPAQGGRASANSRPVSTPSAMVSDDRVVVGSINMDYRSLFLHFECGTLLFHNSQIAVPGEGCGAHPAAVPEIYMRSTAAPICRARALDSVLRLLSPLISGCAALGSFFHASETGHSIAWPYCLRQQGPTPADTCFGKLPVAA